MHIEFDCGPNRVHPSLFGGEHQRFFPINCRYIKSEDIKITKPRFRTNYLSIYFFFLTTRKAAAGMKSILHLQHDFTNQKLLRVEL